MRTSTSEPIQESRHTARPQGYAAPSAQRARKAIGAAAALMLAALCASTAPAQTAAQKAQAMRFWGVYQIVPMNETVPGAPAAKGNPDDMPLTASAAAAAKQANLRLDPAINCRIVGPFRMMAMPANRIELLPSLTGGFYMMFKNTSLGNRRQIEFQRAHSTPAPSLYNGESIAAWQKGDLVVDTIGFNNFTWLNGTGAPHSDKLHMREVYHLMANPEYLQLTVTLDDPESLQHPYTYTRYYHRSHAPLGEEFCQEKYLQNPPSGQ